MTVELKPHQQKAVDELSNGKILYGDVGVGKTFTAMAYFVSKVCKGTYGDYYTMRTPKDIYVITTAKQRNSLDWENAAIKFKISPVREFSIEGVKITVDSWNNINKYKDVKNAFFVFDEQRVVGSGAWTKSFIKIAKSNEWILLSATPGDTWLDYIPVFVANGWYKNRTEFKDRHVVYSHYGKFPKVDRYLETGTLVRHRNALLVHMPYPRHTVRHTQLIDVAHDEVTFQRVVKKRWHVFEQRPLRDIAEMFVVMRKVVNTDESRLKAIRVLMQNHPRLIVFYNYDYELEMLRTLGTQPGTIQTSDPAHSLTRPKVSSSTILSEKHKDDSELNCPPQLPIGSTSVQMSSTSSSHSGNSGTSSTLSVVESGPKSSDERLEEHNSSVAAQNGHPSGGLHLVGSPNKSTTTTAHSISENVDQINSTFQNSNDGDSFVVAEWNGHKHEELPTTDRWVYLVQYQAGAEGWNCITTDAMVFYSMTYSYKLWHQAHGRIDRLNTPFVDLYYYVLRSRSFIDLAIWKALKSKCSFNESAWRDDVAA